MTPEQIDTEQTFILEKLFELEQRLDVYLSEVRQLRCLMTMILEPLEETEVVQ